MKAEEIKHHCKLAALTNISLGNAGLVISHQCVKPSSKLVLLLDDVVRDGTAAVVGWRGPPQSNRLVVKVNDLGVTGRTGRFCEASF